MRALACAAITLVTMAALVPTAFGQAGSTGGTLGNTDKSISGDRETPAPRKDRPAAAARTPNGSAGCREIVGAWTWRVPPLSWQVSIRANGTATHSVDGGVTGTWTCHGDSAVFIWANGRYLDRVTVLSRDALEGTNNQGIRFTGTRQ
jgi:hypothetical protein